MSNILSSAKTLSIKSSEIKKSWKLIDARGMVLGRLAVIVADLLRGKNKPTFTPHMDDGDNVIIINAKDVVLTGNKLNDKIYYHHTGYPGGIKSANAKSIISGKNPERVVIHAIKGMLPRGSLGRIQLKNLRVYSGENHSHGAQNPEVIDISTLSKKNKFRG